MFRAIARFCSREVLHEMKGGKELEDLMRKYDMLGMIDFSAHDVKREAELKGAGRVGSPHSDLDRILELLRERDVSKESTQAEEEKTSKKNDARAKARTSKESRKHELTAPVKATESFVALMCCLGAAGGAALFRQKPEEASEDNEETSLSPVPSSPSKETGSNFARHTTPNPRRPFQWQPQECTPCQDDFYETRTIFGRVRRYRSDRYYPPYFVDPAWRNYYDKMSRLKAAGFQPQDLPEEEKALWMQPVARQMTKGKVAPPELPPGAEAALRGEKNRKRPPILPVRIPSEEELEHTMKQEHPLSPRRIMQVISPRNRLNSMSSTLFRSEDGDTPFEP